MKNRWEIKKLKEIAEYSIGLTYSPSDISEHGTIVLRSSNVQNGKLDFSDTVRVTREFKSNLYVRSGDILMCSRNGSKRLVGKTAVIGDLPEPMTFGTFMTIIRSPLNPYLSWFFQSELFREQIGIGENPMINQITKYMLDDIDVPVPPIEEQRRIVAILDEAFACIDKAKANTEKNIQNARELFDSYLNNIFSNPALDWERMTLGELGSVSMCKRIYKEQTTSEGDIPFYKIGTFGKEPDAFISNEIYDDFRNKYSFPQIGDVLLSAAGTIGRRVKYDGLPAYFQDSNIVWLAHDERKVLNDYLFHFYGACEWASTDGATISRLYNDDLRQIRIAFPKSQAEQQAIVETLDAINRETQRLESAQVQKIAELDELRRSILQKAFSGEL